MDIVVLAAGSSAEREVSINSGRLICEALRSIGHNAIIVDLFFGTSDKNAFTYGEKYDIAKEVDRMILLSQKVEEEKRNRNTLVGEHVIQLCQEADIVFLGLHGVNGEDGRVQAMFDLLGIKYTGTGHLGSAMAMDKDLSKQIFRMNQISTPDSFVITKDNKHESLKDYNMDFPCVVKPCCGGSSIGISIVYSAKEYEKALEDAFTYENEVLVESYISGREFSVGILDNQALPVIEIIPDEGWYDYDKKYNGKTKEECPADLPDDITKAIQQEAVKAAKILRLEAYCRIDFLLDANNNIYCLEANTLPGMTAASLLPQEALQIGLSFPSLCNQLIEISLQKYK